MLQFQTIFLLFISNPPSLLKIKERNWRVGIRIFLVCSSAGKLQYVYKYPFCQPHERRWTVLFVLRQTWSLCRTGLRPYCPCLGICCWLTEHSTQCLAAPEFKWNLHRGTVKSSEHNSELQTLQGAESVLHCSMETKTSHPHTRTGSSTLKSRCMICSQRFFNPIFKRKQCMLHHITRWTRGWENRRILLI